MRSALERGDLDRFGRLLDRSWQDKRNLAPGISNPRIETLYASARAAGALGGKVIGAGGGGYLLFYVSEEQRARVIQALNEVGGTYGGSVYFDLGGPKTWTSDAFRGEVADFILGS
jgi:D-glycero-alpha-D-manno-heptose-7-phosphate kinase